MTFNDRFADERAVSPVIGVIPMVAITVILAAVIGTFVLGLGDNLSNTGPTVTLSLEATSSSSMDVTHDGGDSLETDDLTILVEGTAVDDPDWGSGVENISSGETHNVTDLDHVNAGEENNVRIRHDPSDSIIEDTDVDFP